MTEQTENKLASFIQLTDEGMARLIHVLDIARRTGTRQEAVLALQFVSIIEANAAQLTNQLEEVKTDDDTVETDRGATAETL